jgi:23S rRNA pseudouridine1911/1915/1917 synthase
MHLNKEEDEEQVFFEHYSFKVDPGQEPTRIDVFLTHRIQNATRTKVQKSAIAGCILVNNQAVKSNYKVKPNDMISVVMAEPPRDTEIHPEPMDLHVVWEDEELLIINKPAGLVVHPGYNNYTGTLVHGLAYHFGNLPQRDELSRPGLVHRIDKDTSGLLVVAKTELALNVLAKQFYDHSIDRNYYALVWGNTQEDKGTIRSYLSRDPKDRRRTIASDDETTGKLAVTHYEVVERFYFLTLIKCTLETGRTHQIRAHMTSIGHPLFADELYGGMQILKGSNFSKFSAFISNCFKVMSRQALHAYSLGFDHPSSKERMYFEQALPEDFQSLLERLRKYHDSNQQ